MFVEDRGRTLSLMTQWTLRFGALKSTPDGAKGAAVSPQRMVHNIHDTSAPMP